MPAAIARCEGHTGGESASGAGAGDQQPIETHAERLRVRRHPFQRRVHVFARIRVAMLGRESVLDRHEHDTQKFDEIDHPVQPAEPIAEH